MTKKTTPSSQNKKTVKTDTTTAKKTKETVAPETTKETKKKFSLPPVFSDSVTREDKLSLLSFCLGMIVMTCFFTLDLHIRNYMETKSWEKQMIVRLKNRPAIANRQVQCQHTPASKACGCLKQAPCKKHGKKAVSKQVGTCAKCPPVWKRVVPFNIEEYKPYDTTGTLTLSGNICDALPKGMNCPEKISVFINPKTSYSDEWWTKHWNGSFGITKPDKQALKYNKQTTTDKNGNFTFSHLPTGSYYVGAEVCSKNPKQKVCRPMRLGTLVKMDKDTAAFMEVVHPKTK